MVDKEKYIDALDELSYQLKQCACEYRRSKDDLKLVGKIKNIGIAIENWVEDVEIRAYSIKKDEVEVCNTTVLAHD